MSLNDVIGVAIVMVVIGILLAVEASYGRRSRG